MPKGRPTLNRLIEQERSIPHAVLHELEDEHELPVVVKYGDADAIMSDYGADLCINDYPHDPGWLLFRLESRGLTELERSICKDHMQAIGAWFIGWKDNEMHFLWPKDHPVQDM